MTVRLLLLAAALFLSAIVRADPVRLNVAVPGPGAASYLPIELIPRIGADKAVRAVVHISCSPSVGSALGEVTSNNADFAVVGMPAAMSLRLRDPRIVALAPVNDLPLYVLLVRQGLKGEVRTIADLRGRSIGLLGHRRHTGG